MRGSPYCSLPLVVLGCLACDIPAHTASYPQSAPEFPARVTPSRPSTQSPLSTLQEDPCTAPETLDFVIEGYGRNTVGGWQPGHDVYCVTSLQDDGPGTLRDAVNTGDAPRVIRFAVDGEIVLSRAIDLPSNVSIDGRGRDISLVGKGFTVHGRENVILTHLAIEDVGPDSEDGIQIGFPDRVPTNRVVLDHVRFSQSGEGGNSEYVDEAISVIYGSYDITIAWCRFEHWEKGMLFGNGDAAPEVDANIRVTVHHNYFDALGRRHPMARYGQFDVYNNFLDDWRMFDRPGPPIFHESFGIRCEDECRMIVEQNVFERFVHRYDGVSTANLATYCKTGGRIDDRGGYVTPETTAALRFNGGCERAEALNRPYEAQVDLADGALAQRLRTETGNRY